MTRLLHISDLHFGAVNDRLCEPLLVLAQNLHPDAIIVSGDHTQRARPDQFRAAAVYLARFGLPVLAIPGNHDMPLYNLPLRLFAPFARYRKFFDASLEPSLTLPGAVVLGVNTANPMVWKSGRLRPSSAADLVRRFKVATPGASRIVVMHHAPVPAADDSPPDIADPAGTLRALVAAGADIVLSGHTHMPHFGGVDTAAGILFVQAGTAISTRLKTRWNDVAVIDVTAVDVKVQSWLADGDDRFEPGPDHHFHCENGRWRALDRPKVSAEDLAAQ